MLKVCLLFRSLTLSSLFQHLGRQVGQSQRLSRRPHDTPSRDHQIRYVESPCRPIALLFPSNMPKMASLLRNLTDRFTPSSSSTDLTATKQRPDGFYTARSINALFPRTNPQIDGDECTHDCESCEVRLPKKWSIDESDDLYGHVKGWSRHLIVATGKTDWVRDVADEKNSVMEAVDKHNDEIAGGRLMLSASNIPVPDHYGEATGPYGKDRPTRVLLMPAFQWVEGVTPSSVPALIKNVINTAPTNTQPLMSNPLGSSLPSTEKSEKNAPDGPTHALSELRLSPDSLPDGVSLRACPHRYLILVCSQATRDARCGQSAPLLRKELERHLRPLGLYRDLSDERPGGVGIYFISHVGGHKYSANMMIYRKATPKRTMTEQASAGTGAIMNSGTCERSKDIVEGEAAQCIWLARVRPEDCENIIRYTVLQGKVVKPERQLRGGFDREKGLVSW